MSRLRVLSAILLVLATASPALAQQRTRSPRRPAATSRPRPKPAPPAQALPTQLGVTTESGLTYVITKRTGGAVPATGQTVVVHYTGMLTNGAKFDSSHDSGEPISFPLGAGRVIKGWDEGIAKLGVGDHAVLVIPPELGYGERGAGGVIPPNATLVFVVELVGIEGQ